MMPDRMVVRRVGQRSAESPEIAALSQKRQMLADLNAGSCRIDRLKFAANVVGRLGLRIKAVVL